MPKSKEPSGFQPIQHTPGPQNPPAVPEVDFTASQAAGPGNTRAQQAPEPKPHTAAQTKED